MNPADTAQGRVALKFARALVVGDFDEAHRMLAPGLRESTSASDLARHYAHVLRDADGPPTVIEVHNVMDEWPRKRPGDVGWAYVGICGDDYAEAVTVVIAQVDEGPFVRSVEWGRP